MFILNHTIVSDKKQQQKGGICVEVLRGRGKALQLLKGLVLSGVVTAVVLFLLAFIMLKFQPLAEKMEICILFTYVFACLLGGMYCGHKTGSKKFLWGLLLGCVYFALLLLISGMGDHSLECGLLQGITAFVLCACGGMLGGMLAK